MYLCGAPAGLGCEQTRRAAVQAHQLYRLLLAAPFMHARSCVLSSGARCRRAVEEWAAPRAAGSTRQQA